MNYRRVTLLITIACACILAACASRKPTTPDFAPSMSQENPVQYRARLHTELGAGYYERGHLNTALEELNEALKIDPNYAQAYNILGLVYAVLEETRKAEQSFERAMTLAPNDPQIRNNWGWYLCENKRARDAIPQFDHAMRDPLYKNPEIAAVNAGRCAQSVGEIRQAESYFRRALQVQPGNPFASFGLAEIAFKEARYTEARVFIRGAMTTTTPSPAGLLLGACIERKLGDRQAELSYTSQLRNRFPDAPEIKKLQGGACD